MLIENDRSTACVKRLAVDILATECEKLMNLARLARRFQPGNAIWRSSDRGRRKTCPIAVDYSRIDATWAGPWAERSVMW